MICDFFLTNNLKDIAISTFYRWNDFRDVVAAQFVSSFQFKTVQVQIEASTNVSLGA